MGTGMVAATMVVVTEMGAEITVGGANTRTEIHKNTTSKHTNSWKNPIAAQSNFTGLQTRSRLGI